MKNHRAGLFLLPIVVLLARPARADRVSDLVRIHQEAIGGRKRIEALSAIRASGVVTAGGRRMHFTMLAERPDRVRVETESGGRTLVQASDGRNPPWELDTGHVPPRARLMPAAEAAVFTADAEFDDPLVAGSARGYDIEYAGHQSFDGRNEIRLLVTRNLTRTYSLFVDPDTYLITARVEERKDALGGTTRLVTEYGDYRPVDGVLLPRDVKLITGGRVVQETTIHQIEGNPRLSPDAFTRPGAPAPVAAPAAAPGRS